MESEVVFKLCLFVHTSRRTVVVFTFREKNQSPDDVLFSKKKKINVAYVLHSTRGWWFLL